MRRTSWNTWEVRAYTYQVGTDKRATGGVHLHQIKRTGDCWLRRIVDSNGGYWSAGPASPISDAAGESAFESAFETAKAVRG